MVSLAVDLQIGSIIVMGVSVYVMDLQLPPMWSTRFALTVASSASDDVVFLLLG